MHLTCPDKIGDFGKQWRYVVIQKYFVSVCMHDNALNLVQLEWCNEGVWWEIKLRWHLWTFLLRIILTNINPDYNA